MEHYINIKKEFDPVARSLMEKQKMYIDFARKDGPRMNNKKEKNQPSIDELDSSKYCFSLSCSRGDYRSGEVSAQQWEEYDEANIQGDIIRQRQEDINQIEALMGEVDAMTKDMAAEVAKADANLDLIEENARRTNDTTKKALVEVAKGAAYQKGAFKKT